MHWILQDNLFNEAAYQTLLDTLQRLHIPYSIHKVVPFVGELMPEPDQLEISSFNVICMGSYSLRHQAKRYDWEPGVFDLEYADFRMQKEKWGEHMLNYHSKVVPFKDALFTQEEMFIRPIADSKVFSGALFTREEFAKWHNSVVNLAEDTGTTLTPDTLVQVARPSVIYSEYRFWVVKGDIITASMYKLGRRVIYQQIDEASHPDLHQFVAARIKEWEPHDAFCIDVCYVEDGIKIVEINTLNSCGFYAADLSKLVRALEDSFDTTLTDPPFDGSKRYIEILNAGCGGHRDYWGEFDCLHGYQWSCDECPIVTDKYDDDHSDEDDGGYVQLL